MWLAKPIYRLAHLRYAPHVASILVACGFFVADWSVPLANLSIGYCLVPILAGMTSRRRFLIGMTALCTVLTWSDLEANFAGASQVWVPIFDRAMVTAVLWLTLLLTIWRQRAMAALLRQTEALEAAKRELTRSNSELEGFASVVAHDLRGPLSAIALAASILQRQRPRNDAAEDDDWAESIQVQVTQMDELIRNLLDYGRAGGLPLRLAPCDCGAILSRTRENLKADLQASAGEVIFDALPIVSGDPTLLTRLFQNLIENSLKYHSSAPPRITVSATRDDENWTFRVADNGKGIDPREAEIIFEPFRQAESNQGRYSGIGLGLATCKRIVQRLGGKIWAESQAGNGATFCFTLPCSLPSANSSPQ